MGCSPLTECPPWWDASASFIINIQHAFKNILVLLMTELLLETLSFRVLHFHILFILGNSDNTSICSAHMRQGSWADGLAYPSDKSEQEAGLVQVALQPTHQISWIYWERNHLSVTIVKLARFKKYSMTFFILKTCMWESCCNQLRFSPRKQILVLFIYWNAYTYPSVATQPSQSKQIYSI